MVYYLHRCYFPCAAWIKVKYGWRGSPDWIQHKVKRSAADAEELAMQPDAHFKNRIGFRKTDCRFRFNIEKNAR